MRPALDEQDQEHQYQDLGQHRALEGLDKFVDDPEGHRGEQRPPQIANAAEHHDEKTVDDVVLAEIGANIVNLAQRDAGHTGDARTEAKGQRVDQRRADAHRRCHAPVLGNRTDRPPEPTPAQGCHQSTEHEHREQDDPQAIYSQVSPPISIAPLIQWGELTS